MHRGGGIGWLAEKARACALVSAHSEMLVARGARGEDEK